MLPTFEIIIITAIGLVFGSFATAIIHREINDLSWSFGKKNPNDTPPHRSRCPQCSNPLGVLDLVPIISWLFLRGQCRHCKAPIPALYPLMELLSVSASLAAYAVYGFTLQAAIIICSVPFLISLIVVDLKKMILPNGLVLIVAALGCIHVGLMAINGGLAIALNHISAAILYALIATIVAFCGHKILKKAALGMGDIKLFAVAGLWLGLMPMAEFYMMSGFSGIIIAIIWQIRTKSPVFPFGPAMILSLYGLLLAKGSFLLHFIIQ